MGWIGKELTKAPWEATPYVRKLRPVVGEQLGWSVLLPLPPASEHCSAPFRPGLFFFTFLFYLLSIAAVALMFVYYTESGACHEGKVFIGLNLTFCVCVSIIAVLPKVQVSLRIGRAKPFADVLPACTPALQKRALDLITDACEPPCGCWELNSGPLEEQSVLSTAEPSLQSYGSAFFFFFFWFFFFGAGDRTQGLALPR